MWRTADQFRESSPALCSWLWNDPFLLWCDITGHVTYGTYVTEKTVIQMISGFLRMNSSDPCVSSLLCRQHITPDSYIQPDRQICARHCGRWCWATTAPMQWHEEQDKTGGRTSSRYEIQDTDLRLDDMTAPQSEARLVLIAPLVTGHSRGH